MTFNFGSLSTPAKPAFGAGSFSFGSNAPATTTSAGFGGFGGGFGAATSAAPPAFGANPATTSTAFGAFGSTAGTGFGGFGTNPATTAPTLFGTSFGAPSTAPSTGFPSFGGTTTTAGSFGFGGAKPFGTAPAFGTATTGFGTGTTGFGTGTTGFGTAAPNFGTGSTGFGMGNFGTGTTGFGAGGFGGLGTGTTGFGAGVPKLGVPTTGQFGSFGTGFGTGLGFGQQQQVQQQQPMLNANEALMNAVFNCCRFGDERDQILAKWNFLQAKWGVGKAYYSDSAPPLELTQQNPLCRFKAIGYSLLPRGEDKDGIVALVFTKSEQEIKSNQAQFASAISGLLGNKPNITVHIDNICPISDTRTQVTVYVTEKPVSLIGAPPSTAVGSRAPATELATALQQPSSWQALVQAGCLAIVAQVARSPADLRQYLDTPPLGIDVRLWKQAQADNPDPEKYIPMPMIGFSELKWRSNIQVDLARLQSSWVAKATEKMTALTAKRNDSAATADEARRRLMDLTRRLLKVVGKLETSRKIGLALSPEEESIKMRLHALHSQLASPTLFNGRLSELLSQMRMQRCQSAMQPVERYVIDPDAVEDIKQLLAMEHKGTVHLIETINKHTADLKIIQEGMVKLTQETKY